MSMSGENVCISIHKAVLDSIFDECDRHEHAETGGRLIGTYMTDRRGRLSVKVSGVIEPGPHASRTATSFFQDGDYQERVFRRIESELPDIEHLGNWHSHHVNGFPTLSGGDKATYRRIVNHPNHNTNFFYALLVTEKNRGRWKGERYRIKHFILFRNGSVEYEIPDSMVRVVNEPVVWPRSTTEQSESGLQNLAMSPSDRRALDNEFLKEAYPDLRPFRLKSRKGIYWRGRIGLCDGSLADVRVSEVSSEVGQTYQAEAVHWPYGSKRKSRLPACESGGSAGAAIVHLERQLNQEAFHVEHASTRKLDHPAKEKEMKGMDVLTVYVGQGALALIRNGGEAIFVDAHLPSADERLHSRIETMLARMLKGHRAAGLVLTGFDADHSSPEGVDLILSAYEPRWIMYPKCYKDTDTTSKVFRIIERHETRRRFTRNPLRRLSVRVDRTDSRMLNGLSDRFAFELFSPHIEDMDNSNNSSIVLKVTGLGEEGFSYLITGDTENDRWDRINEIFGEALRADALAAPHHGSKNAAHPGAILSTDPNTVLISAGVDNQYGHPDPQAVRVYCHVAEHVYKTNVEEGVSLYTKRTPLGLETQLAR